MLIDEKNKAIGLLHSGWRGTVGKITLVGIQTMMREYGSEVDNLKLYIGPGIQQCCFSLEMPFLKELPELCKYIHKRIAKKHMDLPGIIEFTAIEAGVKRKNIIRDETCTVDSHRYFSHRRD